MRVKLKVWRQRDAADRGHFETYEVPDATPDMSFLELLDFLNEQLTLAGQEPVAFDHDCREGICGACSLVVDGVPHGPGAGKTTCQLHLRSFAEGATITVEPWRAGPFPVLKDLMVDRSAFDRILAAGGYISTPIGASVDGNAIPVSKEQATTALDAAMCIACGACVAACPNASAMLYVASKVAHLNTLPQGEPERRQRVRRMVAQMDAEGFGGCTNLGECVRVCPKHIDLLTIARLNRELVGAAVRV